MKLQKLFDSTTLKNRGPGRGKAQQIFTGDILFNSFPNFAPLPHVSKITRLRKYTFQQGSIPYQKGISVQAEGIILEISYWKLWPTLQCALQCLLIRSIPIQYITWWFNLFWFLHIENNNFKQGKGKGDVQQLRNLNHKGKHKIGCYPKSILIFNTCQVQGWWTMILSTVKSQTDGRNVREILFNRSWQTHLKHYIQYTFIL